MARETREAIVVGGGLAGLSCTMRLAEKNVRVKLISLTRVKRSHSVCAQGGINAAVNVYGEDDSPVIHAYDTIKGGDFLANQPPVVEMCFAAPSIIDMFDRCGCPFNRTPRGNIDVRRFGGTLYHRTVFCGASTGQQLLYTLDEQVRRFEAKGRVEKFENHEFLRLALDSQGRARGIVLLNLFNLKLEILKADVIIFATGGPGLIFKKSTNSTFCTGAANGRLFMQGMRYANGEFIQVHPTSIPGIDKMRLISESVRGEGGRVWVWGDSSKTILNSKGEPIPCGITGERWYFLEELYPGYGNLVARDVGSREIMRVCQMGMGVDGKNAVYLDVTHLPPETLHKLDSVLDIYKKFTGEDPRKVSMKIFPGVHYSMGGAWVDWPAADDVDRASRFRQMTNIPGCFNVGESDYQYHGANRLGANAMLACIFGGIVAGEEGSRYLDSFSFPPPTETIFQEAVQEEERRKGELFAQEGSENVFLLHEELGAWLIHNVTVLRNNKDLQETVNKIKEIRERYRHISLSDKGQFANQVFQFAHQFKAMLEIALAITLSALYRNESRGAHYKKEFPLRDDENWLKTTVASYRSEEPEITYEKVDLRHLDPEPRDYVVAKKVKPTLKNIPVNLSTHI